jgi:hypothetical protein
MKRDNIFEEEGQPSLMVSKINRSIKDFYATIFSNNPSLNPYGKEIIHSILMRNDNFINNATFHSGRKLHILTNFKIVKKGLTKKEIKIKRFSLFFPICFLSVNISDKIISLTKDINNEKQLQLIYYSSLNIASKFESQNYIPYSYFEKKIKDSLVSGNEVSEFENKINRLLNFDYNIIFPTDILNIYQLVDKTDSNKEIAKRCKFIFLFIIFSKNFTHKNKELVVLIIYYYVKTKIDNQFNWSYDLQLMTGIDKKTIINNMIELSSEIKDNYKFFSWLKDNYYDLI